VPDLVLYFSMTLSDP